MRLTESVLETVAGLEVRGSVLGLGDRGCGCEAGRQGDGEESEEVESCHSESVGGSWGNVLCVILLSLGGREKKCLKCLSC